MGEQVTATGRLFRSLKADGDAATEAIPALALDQAVGLRTVTLGDPIVEAPPIEEPVVVPEPTPPPPTTRGAHAAPGIRALGVWLVVIGVTVVVAFGDALVVGRNGLGWVTGIALLLASIYGAIVVRREDYVVAVIAPPIAFFLATLTAGQLTLLPSGSFLLRESLMIVTTLGNNAAWIFGSTLAALAIVLLRRWLSGRAATRAAAQTPASPPPM